jgi:hypothetical protein
MGGGKTRRLLLGNCDFLRCMILALQMTLVDPLYNRLTVFDPRLPHGVRPVAGTREPRLARVVLHGWFTEPTPFFTGVV